MTVWKNYVRRWLPRRIKAHRIIAGPIQGDQLVTSWHNYPAAITGQTERPLLEWFGAHVNTGQTWLDVGGHYGYTALALSKLVGPLGKVFTFEPVLATACCISETRRLNSLKQLTVVPFGLGSPDTFEKVSIGQTRGMADMTLDGASNAIVDDILIARFDWLWHSLHGASEPIHGIKIDVQGMELQVLAGMKESLRTWKPLLALELHKGVDRREVLAVLVAAGYGAPVPIEPGGVPGELEDNRSYAFAAP